MVHTLIWFVVASSIWTPLQHPNPNWQASWIEWSLPGHWPLYTLPLGEVELNAASQNVWHIALFWSVPNSWPIDASKIRERNIWKVYYAIVFIFLFLRKFYSIYTYQSAHQCSCDMSKNFLHPQQPHTSSRTWSDWSAGHPGTQ